MSNPVFGHPLRSEWLLEDGITYLNHGAFGLTPKKVLAVQDEWRRQLEGNPNRFFTRLLPEALRQAAEEIAAFLGGQGKDWVFVDNATTAVNAILASFPLRAGDEVVVADQCYPAVCATALHHCRKSGAILKEARLPFPATGDEAVVEAFASVLTPRTRLAIVDQITSPTATLLPLAEIARICKERGVAVLADGAHAPGMVEVDVAALGVDWFVVNMHKWAFAPKGCGVLWTVPERQAELHPAVISNGYGKGYHAEFDWQGTRDPTAWLAAPAGIQFLHALGWERLQAHNHRLVVSGAELLSDALQTPIGAPAACVGFTCTVALPEGWVTSGNEAEALMRRLAEAHRIEVAVVFFAGRGWLRLSAQAYNELEDYRRLNKVLGSF